MNWLNFVTTSRGCKDRNTTESILICNLLACRVQKLSHNYNGTCVEYRNKKHRTNTASPMPSAIPDKLYQSVDVEELSKASKYLFDSEQWVRWMNHHQLSTAPPPNKLQNTKGLRRQIIAGTLNAFRSLEYIPQSDKHERVQISQEQLIHSCLGVKFYSTQAATQLINSHRSVSSNKSTATRGAPPRRSTSPVKKTSTATSSSKASSSKTIARKTIVTVMSGDCLEAALLMREVYPKVAVLNMASDKRPGGGYKEGSAAQEENLFRRTSLAFSLEDIDKFDAKRTWKYPLPEIGGVYVPSVLLIRGSEMKGYPFLNQIYDLDVITVAAYRQPQLDSQGKKIQSQAVVENTKKKMRLMLAMAKEHNIQCVVLSAWGCGAFKNPPEHIAQLFSQVLNEYDGVFEQIVFAIYEDANSKGGNIAPFEKVFSQVATPVIWNESQPQTQQ